MTNESHPVDWDKAAQSFDRMRKTHGEEIIRMADGTQHMEEAQPSPDLESVRRLIEIMDEYHSRLDALSMPPTRPVLDAVWGAESALRSMLAEVTRLREENARMKETRCLRCGKEFGYGRD